MRKRHLLLIPGIGDRAWLYRLAVPLWRGFGYDVHVHAFGWNGGSSELQERQDCLTRLADRFLPEPLYVIGASAGGVAAVNMLVARPSIRKVVTVASPLLPKEARTYELLVGAPLRLFNWGAVPGYDSNKVVWVNAESLSSFDHMNVYPASGTWLASAETGVVYRVAGGAALRLYNWGAIPGFDGGKVVWVNQQTLDTNDHLLATPSDGTVLQGLPSGNYWQITAGHRTQVAAQSGAVQVDDQTVETFPIG